MGIIETPHSSVPAAPTPTRRWHEPAIMAGIFGLSLLFLWLRVPTPEHSVVWAEDGHLFFIEAAERGPWSLLLEPYAGYQHLIPRLATALILELLPLRLFAVAIFAGCILVTAGIAVATYWLSRSLVQSRIARIGLAAVPVVLPLMGIEIIGNLADLHTYCMWLALWILLWTPRSWLASAAWSVVLLACVLTEVQTLLLVPVALARFRPSRPMLWPPIAATIVGVAVQVTTWVLSPRTGYTDDVAIGIPDIVVGWLTNAVLPTLSGSRALNAAMLVELGVVVTVVALVPFAIAAVVALMRGSWPQRGAAVTLMLLSAAIMGGSLLGSPSTYWLYSTFSGEDWATALIDLRYGAASGLYLAALVPLALGIVIDRAPETGRGAASRILAGCVVVLFVALMTVQAPLSGSGRGGVAGWSGQVDAADAACDAGAEDYVLLVAPQNREVPLTCDMIDDAIDHGEYGQP